MKILNVISLQIASVPLSIPAIRIGQKTRKNKPGKNNFQGVLPNYLLPAPLGKIIIKKKNIAEYTSRIVEEIRKKKCQISVPALVLTSWRTLARPMN